MKFKLFLSAALVAGVISVRAVTSDATATNTAAAPDAMTALFGDPVIATGKGFEIKRSDLDNVVTGAKANAAAAQQQLPPDFEISVLNQLITIQLLLQTANAADRASGQTESDEQFTNLLEHFGSPEAFARQLKMVGMTESQLRTKASQEATAKEALKRELNVQIADAAVLDYYSNHTAAFEQPEKMHVRHILLLTIDPETHVPLTTNAVADKRKLIDDIQKRATGGEDFATLAETYSEDTGSKDKGGELPEFGRGDMPAEIEAAAFSLKPGQVSEVITFASGFDVIKAIDRSPAKQYGLTDIIPQIDKTPAAVCKEELESEQIRDLAPPFVEKLRAQAGVKILDPELNAMEQSALDAASNAPAAGIPSPAGANP